MRYHPLRTPSLFETVVLSGASIVLALLVVWLVGGFKNPLDHCVLKNTKPPCVTWRTHQELAERMKKNIFIVPLHPPKGMWWA
jgi:hypothetical protein